MPQVDPGLVHTGPMTRRAADWAIGALGMLLLLIVAAVVLWFVLSDPVTDVQQSASPTPVTRATGPAVPPSDLGKDETWLGDMDVESNIVVLPNSSLLDVEAEGYGARSGLDGVVVERLEVRATVPFANVEAELGGDSRVSPGEDGQAAIERKVEVLGRQLSIKATGTVEAKNGLLVVEPRSIDLGGPEVISKAIAAAARQFVTIEHPIAGLPKNLVLQDVTVQEDGFRAELSGQDVVLSEGES